MRAVDLDDNEEETYYDDDEDDDVDGEGRGRASQGKKKKRRKGNALIDMEAEEDDAEDDDDDEGDINGLIADADEDDGDVDAGREHARAQRLQMKQALRNDEDPEAFERYMRERYGGDENYADDDAEDGAPDTSGIDQQSLLPTIRDPRLYIVRCRKPGHERRAIFSLLQKSFNLKRKGIDIGIFSAIAPEHLRGRIYIEAFSAAQVEFAINGLDLFTSYEGIKALRLEEMTDVLKVAKRLDKQVEGNWVRLTRGMYKGDLAQVCSVRDGGNESQIMIRLIPRLDVKGERDLLENVDDEDFDDDEPGTGLGSRRKGRPPQKLFDKKELFRLTGSADVYTQRDRQTGEVFESWNSELYKFGLIYKRVSVKTLIVGEAVHPQVEELEMWLAAEQRMRITFEDDPNSMNAEEARRGLGLDINSIAGKRNVGLFKGDSVRVTNGEQKGLTGTIAAVDGDVVLIQTPDFPEPLRVSRMDVSKTFNVGDHIKVATGKRAGHTGVIVAVDGEFLTVFTDSTREEIRVLSSSVADSSDITSTIGAQKAGLTQGRLQYELFDLVQLLADSNDKGVVIQVQNDVITLLTAQNMVTTVPIGEIKCKVREASARALDARDNPISTNDTIHVTSGPLKDRQGVVKHVSGPTVFFKARDEVKNCGMLAVAAKSCTASTAAARRLTATFNADSAFKMPAPIPRGSIASVGRGGFGGGGGGRGGGRPGGDELLRKDVKIIKGPWKGYRGKVVDANDKTVRVELTSKMKTVTLTRDKVKDVDAPRGSLGGLGGLGRGAGGLGNSSGGAYQLGMSGNRTPAHGAYGSQTPARSFGGMTPAHTGGYNRTPAHRGFGSSTPAHPSAGGFTPSHSGYGSMTPSRDAFRPVTPARADDYGSFAGGGNPYAQPSRLPTAMTPVNNTPMNPYSPYVGEPQTPATPLDIAVPSTPQYGGVMEPRTPANIVEPNTPAQFGMEPHTPAPGAEPHTPAPGMEPATPLMHEPATPHTPGMVPQTPLPPEAEAQLGYRVLVDVVVSVRSQANVSAVVVEAAVDGSVVVVRLLDGDLAGTEMTIPGADITPVQPRPDVGEEHELVKVLDGPRGGRTGRLQIVNQKDDGTLEGFVRFENGEEDMLLMSLVAKCYDRGST